MRRWFRLDLLGQFPRIDTCACFMGEALALSLNEISTGICQGRLLMRSMSHLVEILGIGVFLLAAGCSSSKGADASGQGGGYNVGTPGANGGTAPDGYPTAQSSTDPNGLLAVSAATATALQNASTVCQGWEAEPEGGGGAIMEFIVDITSSMTEANSSDPSVAGSPTKWAVFSQTLPQVFDALTGSYAVGVMYFSAQTNQCYVANRADVPIAAWNATQLAALNNSVATVVTGGSTPTYQAWSHGYDLVTAWTPGANDPPALTNAGRYLVLITDGVPTVGRTNDCTYYQDGISQTEYETELNLIYNTTQASKTTYPPNGVETFVVGVIGSNNPQNAVFDPMYMLSRLAVIGGTAPAGCVPKSGTVLANDVQPRGTYCHIDLSQSTNLAADLSTALNGITSGVLSCTYGVPAAPAGKTIDPNQTILVFTDGATGATSIVLENTSSTCDKGWHFTDSTNTTIEICGTSCTAIQANSKLTLNLVFGCTAQQIPIN